MQPLADQFTAERATGTRLPSFLRSLLAVVLLLPFAPGYAQGIYPGDAVIINGESISYQRYYGYYNEYRNSKGVAVGARGDQMALLDRVRREAMDQLIDQELAAQAAERAGIKAPEAEVEAAIDELKQFFDDDKAYTGKLELEGFTRETFHRHIRRTLAAKRYLDGIRLDASAVTEEEIEQYYRDNESRLTYPEQRRVRHILLQWKQIDTMDNRDAVRAAMRPILERARAGEDFAELARQHSEDEGTRENGGDTGFFYPGHMVPEFEAAAYALEPGGISDLVETDYGVHIIRLEDVNPPRLVALDDVRDKLREYIRAEKSEQAVEEELALLRSEADIKLLIPVTSIANRGS